MNILAAFIEHFNTFVRNFVQPSKKILLPFDGHSSRNRIEWMPRCMKQNIQVVQVLANNSLVLQPCNQVVNKRFKEVIRVSKPELDKMDLNETKTI